MRLHIGWRALHWGVAILTLLLAWQGRKPYLIAVRDIELPLAIGLCGITFASAIRLTMRRRFGRTEGILLAAMVLLAAGITGGRETHFQRQRAEVLGADWATKALGRHFIVGYSTFDEVARLSERGLIAGVYIGRKNARGKSLGQLRAEIDALQHGRTRAGLPPLLIAADQEGGRVAHLTPPLQPMPSLSALVESGTDASLEKRAQAYGEIQGRGLASLGINLNFGPVVDLRPGEGGPRFDTHTLIEKRAISSSPDIVTRVARAYGEGLMSQRVLPTLKHFPGLGRVTVDTHHLTGRVHGSKEQLTESDWLPFRRIANDGAAIMLGHVIVDAIDPVNPASLSRSVVQNLIRREWGFDGLLITDDLNMGAVSPFGICNAAVASLGAGVDLVLVSYDPDQYYVAMYCAADALRTGALDQMMLIDSRRRIDTSTHTIVPAQLVQPPHPDFRRETVRSL